MIRICSLIKNLLSPKPSTQRLAMDIYRANDAEMRRHPGEVTIINTKTGQYSFHQDMFVAISQPRDDHPDNRYFLELDSKGNPYLPCI